MPKVRLKLLLFSQVFDQENIRHLVKVSPREDRAGGVLSVSLAPRERHVRFRRLHVMLHLQVEPAAEGAVQALPEAGPTLGLAEGGQNERLHAGFHHRAQEAVQPYVPASLTLALVAGAVLSVCARFSRVWQTQRSSMISARRERTASRGLWICFLLVIAPKPWSPSCLVRTCTRAHLCASAGLLHLHQSRSFFLEAGDGGKAMSFR